MPLILCKVVVMSPICVWMFLYLGRTWMLQSLSREEFCILRPTETFFRLTRAVCAVAFCGAALSKRYECEMPDQLHTELLVVVAVVPLAPSVSLFAGPTDIVCGLQVCRLPLAFCVAMGAGSGVGVFSETNE